ncbi:MAG: 3-dehydroquinate synthase, partial [Candidatus Omnitrophica bacterium]|nr:3-dehydroquinate synthase [Candidatus Omnitrophota bacterium]
SILSLSGGVIGDLSGFVAATYMRGIAYVQVPTTLLAQVDSSVGGKTGVNLLRGKNLVGAFYQPRLVYIDTDVLKTLSDDELKAGLAEVVKYGVIRDKKLFEYLEENIDKILKKDPAMLEHIIACSCRIKAEVVSEDEKESGLRAILNYGHTIGHAIEATSGYGMYKHGQAVAIGMVYAGRIALKLEMISQEALQRQTDLLKKIGLPVELPDMDLTKITEAILLDKKIEADKIRFILPQRIGKVIIHPDISLDLTKEVLAT